MAVKDRATGINEAQRYIRVRGPIATEPSTTRVQSLIVRVHGVSVGDYLTRFPAPEPPVLDHGLRSVATSADPRGEPWAAHRSGQVHGSRTERPSDARLARAANQPKNIERN